MKRFILVTALFTFIAGTFAAIVPASADKHGDRMRSGLQVRLAQVLISVLIS